MSLIQTLTVLDGDGATQDIPTIPNNLARTAISFSGSGDNMILGGVAAKTIKVYRLRLQVAAPTNITLKDSSGATLEGPYVLGTGGSIELSLSAYAHMECTTADDFTINSSSAVQVTGSVLTLTS